MQKLYSLARMFISGFFVLFSDWLVTKTNDSILNISIEDGNSLAIINFISARTTLAKDVEGSISNIVIKYFFCQILF